MKFIVTFFDQTWYCATKENKKKKKGLNDRMQYAFMNYTTCLYLKPITRKRDDFQENLHGFFANNAVLSSSS